MVFAAVALGQLERLDELVAYRVAAACAPPALQLPALKRLRAYQPVTLKR